MYVIDKRQHGLLGMVVAVLLSLPELGEMLESEHALVGRTSQWVWKAFEGLPHQVAHDEIHSSVRAVRCQSVIRQTVEIKLRA